MRVGEIFLRDFTFSSLPQISSETAVVRQLLSSGMCRKQGPSYADSSRGKCISALSSKREFLDSLVIRIPS